MLITFSKEERMKLTRYMREYLDETGDTYDPRYVITLIAKELEDHLWDATRKVIEKKKEEYRQQSNTQ